LAVAPTLLSDEFYERLAEFCKGQANPKRLKIINLLANGEKSVSEISNILKHTSGKPFTTPQLHAARGRSKVQERGGNGLLQAGGRTHSSGLQPSQTDDDGEVWVRKTPDDAFKTPPASLRAGDDPSHQQQPRSSPFFPKPRNRPISAPICRRYPHTIKTGDLNPLQHLQTESLRKVECLQKSCRVFS
jgi:hypothetical protein